ncbi:MAG: efflux RND transporter permease subunit [Candidatus Woesearchaeota archaeon]
MNLIKKLIKLYAKFASNRPFILLIIVIIISILTFFSSTNVGTKTMDNEDTLPDGLDVIESFKIIEDSFGRGDSILIAIQLDPINFNYTKNRDIKHIKIVEYTYTLAKLVENTNDVISTESLGTLLKKYNNNVLPKSQKEINDLINKHDFSSYLNDDFSFTLIRIQITDSYNAEELVKEVENTIDYLNRPVDLKVEVAGEIASSPIIEKQIGPDMGKTSRIAIFGILTILILLFFSVRYALTPIFVIGIGVLWTFGFFGLIRLNISPQTSGAISMIIGIGIDFGIQTISRFREELKNKTPKKAMQITLENVFMPMTTTTIAALIGFKAMSMGELTFLAELATVMSYGVLFCFFAALSVIPPIAVIGEEININIKKYFSNKKLKKTVRK